MAALIVGALARPAAAATARLTADEVAAAKKKPCKRPKRTCGKQCVNVEKSTKHCGGCNQACGANEICQAGVCGPAACAGPCRVFTTSTPFTGNLGGLIGADDKCNARAVAAGLPGTYNAWLSDGKVTPRSRFTRSPEPYQLVDTTVIAANWTELTSGDLQSPINQNEFGGPVLGFVWTGTWSDVTSAPRNRTCQGWTTNDSPYQAVVGSPASSTDSWSGDPQFRVDCANAQPLYCFQQTP